MSAAQRPPCEQQVPSAEPPDPGASPRRRPAVRPGRGRAGGEAESSSGALRRSPRSAGSGCAVAPEPGPRGPLRLQVSVPRAPAAAARSAGAPGPGRLLQAPCPGSAGWRAEAVRKVPCLCARGRVCSRSELGNSLARLICWSSAQRSDAPVGTSPCAGLEKFAGLD